MGFLPKISHSNDPLLFAFHHLRGSIVFRVLKDPLEVTLAKRFDSQESTYPEH